MICKYLFSSIKSKTINIYPVPLIRVLVWHAARVQELIRSKQRSAWIPGDVHAIQQIQRRSKRFCEAMQKMTYFARNHVQNVFFYCETKSQQYQLNSESAVSLFLSTEAIGTRVRRRIISVLVNLYQIYLSYILLQTFRMMK